MVHSLPSAASKNETLSVPSTCPASMAHPRKVIIDSFTGIVLQQGDASAKSGCIRVWASEDDFRLHLEQTHQPWLHLMHHMTRRFQHLMDFSVRTKPLHMFRYDSSTGKLDIAGDTSHPVEDGHPQYIIATHRVKFPGALEPGYGMLIVTPPPSALLRVWRKLFRKLCIKRHPETFSSKDHSTIRKG